MVIIKISRTRKCSQAMVAAVEQIRSLKTVFFYQIASRALNLFKILKVKRSN